MNNNPNPSIHCVVNECRFNDNSSSYCTLDKITVGKNESYSNKEEDTDCKSFMSKAEKTS